MAGRLETAISRPQRPPDLGDGHRGGDRARLPRCDPSPRDRPARPRLRAVRRGAAGGAGRCADAYAPEDGETRDNSPEFREAGLPHGGGYGTARAMAAFYQMM